MPQSLTPIIVRSKPGIKRDGTQFDGDNYTDGQWVRFQRGLPRKIGGYRRISDSLSAVSRGLHVQSRNQQNYMHSGSYASIDRLLVDSSGNASVISDRTPSGFIPNSNNMWQFDTVYDVATSKSTLFAHAGQNALDISSSVDSPVYYGDVYGTTALTAITSPISVAVSGGIVALQPYLMAFGNDGYVTWSAAGKPTDFNDTANGAGSARVTGQKLVRGLPMRSGGGNSPSGILWSLDSVVRASWTGGTTVFRFDTLSSQSSILSASSVIEYDGVYFWCGVDRFMMFNGVVREVDNQMNLNWFFDNLNYAQRQRVFALKVPRFGEIWWCYPRGSATECTHAVIFNVREGSWYDTALPAGGRSAAQYAQVFNSPIMADATPTASSGGKLWQHEFGTDEIEGTDTRSIRSFFETADVSPLVGDQPVNSTLHCEFIEPDFVQHGDMKVSVAGRANARSREVESAPVTFGEISSIETQIVAIRENRRQMRFKFESDTIGGDYQMGQVVAHVSANQGTMK